MERPEKQINERTFVLLGVVVLEGVETDGIDFGLLIITDILVNGLCFFFPVRGDGRMRIIRRDGFPIVHLVDSTVANIISRLMVLTWTSLDHFCFWTASHGCSGIKRERAHNNNARESQKQ